MSFRFMHSRRTINHANLTPTLFLHVLSPYFAVRLSYQVVTVIVPIFSAVLFLVMMIASSDQIAVSVFFAVLDFLYLSLALYGYHRVITSYFYALHVAIVRDGVKAVHDDHIFTPYAVVAVLHFWDTCRFVSKTSETVRTLELHVSMLPFRYPFRLEPD